MAEFGEGVLEEYYKTSFILMNKHNFSLSELENMIPFEKDIYVFTLLSSLKEKE